MNMHYFTSRLFSTAVAQKIVIIGGVAGGASFAARARRLNEKVNIVMLDKGAHVSFANCGLPYYIGGVIDDASALSLHTPASLSATLNIDIRTNTTATKIDRSQKLVHTVRGDGRRESLPYDKLMLSPGAFPIVPPGNFKGDRILTLRTLEDMHAIKAFVDRDDIKRVAVVGAGFIGLEMAEQLVQRGKLVTVVEAGAHVLSAIDGDMAGGVERELAARGVQLKLGRALKSIDTATDAKSLHLNFGPEDSGAALDVDLVVLCIGVRPDTQFIKEAGIECSTSGHIVVNSFQQTSDPSIYAVGDAVLTADGVFPERSIAAALAGPANRCARLAADHMLIDDTDSDGVAHAYPGSLGTAVVRVFDATVGVTGWTEQRLQRASIPYRCTILNGNSHASWFPDPRAVVVKICWDPNTGKLLGGQVSGSEGVDKRLDVLSVALRAGMTIYNLVHLEFAYAPPFNSAKDPINLVAFMATNEKDGLIRTRGSLAGPDAPQIVDVRGEAVSKRRRISATLHPNVFLIPLPQLRARLGELDRARPVITVCNAGKTSYFAARILTQNGFNAFSYANGTHPFPAEGVVPPLSTVPAPASAPGAVTCHAN